MKAMRKCICKCGKEFTIEIAQIKWGKGKYCSKTCMYKYRIRPKGLKYVYLKPNKAWFKKGQRAKNWNGFLKGIIPWNQDKGDGWTENGYIKISVHQKAIPKHRFMIEQYLKEKLDKNMVVHHINGDKLDNKLENLEILTRGEHTRLHNQLRRGINV